MPRPATFFEAVFAISINTRLTTAFIMLTAEPTPYCILPRPIRYTHVSMTSATSKTLAL